MSIEIAPNPFATPEGAESWIGVVEGHDTTREELIYPRVGAWAETLEPETTVVDIGCGQGRCASLLPDSMHYVGLDPSLPLIERARELDVNEQHSFFVGDAENIGLPDSSVGAALSVHVLFHLADLALPSEEIARILEPGGKAFFTTANPNSYGAWEGRYSNATEDGKLLRGTVSNGEFVIKDSTFYRHSFDDIMTAFAKAGFGELVIDEFGRHDDMPTSMSISATKL